MKNAMLFGSKGNLGPIWAETLSNRDINVWTYDPPQWNAWKDDLIRFNRAIDSDIVLYNAAIDNPPGSGVSFFTNLQEIMEVNLLGACKVTERILPYMVERKQGLFVYIGSIQGFVGADWRNYEEGFEKPCGYNVSKAGLMQLARSVAVQYGKYNIRAVCIAFAAVDTGKFQEPFKSKFLRCLPLGRFISKESLKATLNFVIDCPELTGVTVLVDGGYTSW